MTTPTAAEPTTSDLPVDILVVIQRKNEHARKPILVLDFDGVIHSYASGWQGAAIVPDPPVPGAILFIVDALKSFRVAILSSRSHEPGGIDAMRGWLLMFMMAADIDPHDAREAFDAVEWPTVKPPAFLTIDDRALTFDGTWPSIEALKAFQPWNKEGVVMAAAEPAAPVTGERTSQAAWDAAHYCLEQLRRIQGWEDPSDADEEQSNWSVYQRTIEALESFEQAAAMVPSAPADLVALVQAALDDSFACGEHTTNDAESYATAFICAEASHAALLAAIGRMGRGTAEALPVAGLKIALDIATEVSRRLGNPQCHGAHKVEVAIQRRLGEVATEVLAAPPPPPAGDLTLEEWWQDHLDKNDRNSPEEYPDMVLVTFEEMADALATCSARSSRQSASPAPAHVPKSVALHDVVPLADAMWQLLDDMGADGLSVCPAAKAAARLAYEPFADADVPLEYTAAAARAVALSSTATEPSSGALPEATAADGLMGRLGRLPIVDLGIAWPDRSPPKDPSTHTEPSPDAPAAMVPSAPADLVALVDAYGNAAYWSHQMEDDSGIGVARNALLAAIGRMGGAAVPAHRDVFNGLHVERLVREWFSTPLAAAVAPRLVDGLIDVLRMRLSRAAPPPPPAGEPVEPNPPAPVRQDSREAVALLREIVEKAVFCPSCKCALLTPKDHQDWCRIAALVYATHTEPSPDALCKAGGRLCSTHQQRAYLRHYANEQPIGSGPWTLLLVVLNDLEATLTGVDGAAKQASLCDLIEPAKRLRSERDAAEARAQAAEAEAGRLREAFQDLESTASRVAWFGPITGPHWPPLSTALVKARAALAPQGSEAAEQGDRG